LELAVAELQVHRAAAEAALSEMDNEVRTFRGEVKSLKLQMKMETPEGGENPDMVQKPMRLGMRDNQGREGSLLSLNKSDDEFSFGSDPDSDDDSCTDRVLGPAVPGLVELTPSRSAYKKLLSYLAYRLSNLSQRYDTSVAAKLATYAKRLSHSIEEKFDGSEPIAILDFLKSFKEAADHNCVSEGAAARLLPYFLTGLAREEYRSAMKELPSNWSMYPRMVQRLLETYASDDELAKAYHIAAMARQREHEDEKSFALRLRQLAASAGNVFDEATLKSIFVDGLSEYVQDSPRTRYPGHAVREGATRGPPVGEVVTTNCRAVPGFPVGSFSRSRPVG
jgi:hypothetical protein